MRATIESLEGRVWPEPDFQSSLVHAGHALRKKPIASLTPGKLRLAFQENIGAEFLKRRVLEMLSAEPANNVTYYDGDLLLAVLRSQQFRNDPDFGTKIKAFAKLALALPECEDVKQESEALIR